MEKVRQEIEEYCEDAQFIENADGALLGYIELFEGSDGRIISPLYEKEKLAGCLIDENGDVEFPANAHILTKFTSEQLLDHPIYGKLRYHTGYEDSIVGVLSFGEIACVVHDQEALIEKMTKEYEEDGSVKLSEDESYYDMAIDFFNFNTIGGYVGKDTPGFATFISKEDFKKEEI